MNGGRALRVPSYHLRSSGNHQPARHGGHQQPTQPTQAQHKDGVSKATDYLAKTWRKFWKSPPAAKAIVILFLCSGLLVLTIIAVFGPKLIGQKLYDWSQELRKFQYGWLILTAIIGASHSPHSGLGERC